MPDWASAEPATDSTSTIAALQLIHGPFGCRVVRGGPRFVPRPGGVRGGNGVYPSQPVSIHWPMIRSCLARPLKTVATDDQRSYRGIDILVGALHLADAIEAVCKSQMVGVM